MSERVEKRGVVRDLSRRARRTAGRVVLPVAVALATPVAVQAKAPRPLSNKVIAQNLLHRILHHEPVEACQGDLAWSGNVNTGAAQYSPQPTGGDAYGQNYVPEGKRIEGPYVANSLNPNAPVPANANFGGKRYVFAGLDLKSPTPSVDVYPLGPGKHLEMAGNCGEVTYNGQTSADLVPTMSPLDARLAAGGDVTVASLVQDIPSPGLEQGGAF